MINKLTDQHLPLQVPQVSVPQTTPAKCVSTAKFHSLSMLLTAPGVLGFFCELCKDDPDKVNMNYKGKRGLSGHQRQAHPATYHTNNVPVPKKKCWDDEELVVMAQYELEAPPPGTKFINLYLVTKFPGTSNTQLEACGRPRDTGTF